MRIRTIKPEFWTHPVMARLKDQTKLLALGITSLADDEGYFYAEPRMVRNAIRPFDDYLEITIEAINELVAIGYLKIRKHHTHGYVGMIESFQANQSINKPKQSKIKAFYDNGTDTVSIRDEYRSDTVVESDDVRNEEATDISEHVTQTELVDYKQNTQEIDELFMGRPKIFEGKGDDILREIWELCPVIGRSRSSKKQVSDAWRGISKKDKPTNEYLKQSFEKWTISEDWTKDNGQYVPALHLWFKNRKWEVEPLTRTPMKTKGGIDDFGV